MDSLLVMVSVAGGNSLWIAFAVSARGELLLAKNKQKVRKFASRS